MYPPTRLALPERVREPEGDRERQTEKDRQRQNRIREGETESEREKESTGERRKIFKNITHRFFKAFKLIKEPRADLKLKPSKTRGYLAIVPLVLSHPYLSKSFNLILVISSFISAIGYYQNSSLGWGERWRERKRDRDRDRERETEIQRE